MSSNDTSKPQLAGETVDSSLDHPAETSRAADDLPAATTQANAEEEEDEEEGEDEEQGTRTGGDAGAAPKKKRKPKKKKSKAAGGGVDAQNLVTPQSSNPIAASDIPSLLQQLALAQPNSKKQGKAPEDYKFWNTQPVPKFKESDAPQKTDKADGKAPSEGPILPDEVCKAGAKDQPEKLLDGFEWCLIDLENAEELREFYELLTNHYVEDTDGSFRFDYSPAFLSWALKPPGWNKDWHIGVRTKTSDAGKKGKLVASITGIPITLCVRNSTVKASEINFLAIHRKLRSKRLAPQLIKEVTRKCYRSDTYQALYTAGELLPTPVTTCRYFHRPLDWEHLHRAGFSHLPPGSTELRQKYRFKLESHTLTKGLRPMKATDIPSVRDLLVRYTARFHLRQEFSEEEIAHWLCSDTSKDVVYSHVVEENGKVTDFISYYVLNSTVLKSSKKDTIRAAYLYYYATETVFKPSPKGKGKEVLQARLRQLVHDALILAAKDNAHVFNALTLLDNPLFLEEEKFAPGDGDLNYYLYNWRTPPLNGGVNKLNQIDTTKMDGIGVVML